MSFYRFLPNYSTLFVMALLVGCSSTGALGGGPSRDLSLVILNESFDKQPDWRPHPASNDVSPSGAMAACDYPDAHCPWPVPSGWSYFRSTGLWWAPKYHDTISIGREVARGNTGKALIVYNESNHGASGDGWGADGQLTKLFDRDYQEIYARIWLKTQSGWQWPVAEDMGIKVFRVFHFDRAGSIYEFFPGGHSAPIFVWDFKHSPKWGTRVANTIRCAPQKTDYYCSSTIPNDLLFVRGDYQVEPSAAGMLADGNWHSLEFYFKLNTWDAKKYVWNRDGEYAFWYDGRLVESHSDVQYARSGAKAGIGWNAISLGGNAYNTYAPSGMHAEQWYAIDDVLVSTRP